MDDRIYTVNYNGQQYRVWDKGGNLFVERFTPMTIGAHTIMAPVPATRREREAVLGL